MSKQIGLPYEPEFRPFTVPTELLPQFRHLSSQELAKYIAEGVKTKDYVDPYEGPVAENQETIRDVGGHKEKAWWHWDEQTNPPQWIREVDQALKPVSENQQKKLADQEAEQAWDRRDNRGGPW